MSVIGLALVKPGQLFWGGGKFFTVVIAGRRSGCQLHFTNYYADTIVVARAD